MYSSHNSIWQLSFSLHFDSKYIYRQLPEFQITVGHLLSVTLEIQITLVIAIMIMTASSTKKEHYIYLKTSRPSFCAFSFGLGHEIPPKKIPRESDRLVWKARYFMAHNHGHKNVRRTTSTAVTRPPFWKLLPRQQHSFGCNWWRAETAQGNNEQSCSRPPQTGQCWMLP